MKRGLPCSDDINRAVYDGIANARAAIARVSWFPRSLRLPFRIRVSPTWSAFVAKRNNALLHAALSAVLTVSHGSLAVHAHEITWTFLYHSSLRVTGIATAHTASDLDLWDPLTVLGAIANAEGLYGIVVFGIMLALSRDYDHG